MIVYTPLDIKFTLPKYHDVLKYVEENYILGLEEHTGYTSWLCPIATPFPANDYRNASDVFPPNELDDFKQLNFVPGILEKFPEITDIINSLPYEVLYGVSFNLHRKILPPHRDTLIDLDPPNLERINILLSPHYRQQSFFLQEQINSDPIYPVILDEYPAYAFNDTNMYHGADPVLDNRIIMVFVGKLNKEKYSMLIEKSVEKFKEYIIKV
jgi:hypothetical protein